MISDSKPKTGLPSIQPMDIENIQTQDQEPMTNRGLLKPPPMGMYPVGGV